MTIKEPEQELVPPEPQLLPTARRPREIGAPGPARRSDYRLRGLDLEAQANAEYRPRLVRKKHWSRIRRRRRLLLQWTAVLVVLAATTVLLRVSVLQPYSVRSTSMVPTLQPGTNVLVVKPRLLTGSIKVGDIVVFHRPEGFNCRVAGDASRDLIKRVIGLPSQTIWSAKERIYVDGQPLNEPGWYNQPYGEVGPTKIARTTIPSGSYFVLGDNRTDTCDSRAFGPIAASSVTGRAVLTTTRGGHPFLHFL